VAIGCAADDGADSIPTGVDLDLDIRTSADRLDGIDLGGTNAEPVTADLLYALLLGSLDRDECGEFARGNVEGARELRDPVNGKFHGSKL
jgi:hypothetical protein